MIKQQGTFRLKFYELVENYQYIEGWLEYIYAWFNKRGLLEGLEEVEKTNLRRLLDLVKGGKNDSGEPIFTDIEISDLVRIVERRNFWIHSALFDLPFDNRTDELKKDCHKQQMEEDLRLSRKYREILYNKQNALHNDSSDCK